MNQRAQIAAFVLIALFGVCGLAAPDLHAATSDAVAVPEPNPQLRSPQGTIQTFIESINDFRAGADARLPVALECLDLSQLPSQAKVEHSALLAEQLKEIIDRLLYVSPDKTMGEVRDDRFIVRPDPESPVPQSALNRYSLELTQDAAGNWRFSPDTMAVVGEFHRAIESYPRLGQVTQGLLEGGRETGPRSTALRIRARVMNHAPTLLREVALLEVWQWLGLLLTILAGFALGQLAAALGFLLINRLAARWMTINLAHQARLKRPAAIAATAWIWYVGLRLLGLPVEAANILVIFVKIVTAASILLILYRMVDVIHAALTVRAAGTETKFDDILVPMITRSLKVFLVAFGLVFIADLFEWDMTGILAGLGLGGLAVALAARDTLENLFGSFTVLADRPFKLGDWVVIGENEGTVERVGFRSTRIRTFYNSLITVPNSALIKAVVDNMGERRYRRIRMMLGLQYDTPAEKVEAFCEGIRELIRRHPYTRKDYFHVYFNEYADFSLNILLYCFLETPDWSTELRERHRLLLDILRLARDLGVEFAFPTRTVHLYSHPAGETAPGGFPAGASDALRAGRQSARIIVDREFPPGSPIPPPVAFDFPPENASAVTEITKGGDSGAGD